MCMTDSVQETVDQLRLLANKLEVSDQLFKGGVWSEFDASLTNLHPELLYVVNTLIGVVSLKAVATPTGGTMMVADKVDEDGLSTSFE